LEVGALRPLFVRGHERLGEDGVTQVYERERELQREIQRAVAAGEPAVEVLAVELSGPERFCVYIDRPGGVDLDLCERVSGLLRAYLDRYTVDVSSPGLDRPLRTPEHFAQAQGRRVTVRTAHEIAGRKRFKGSVAEARTDALQLELDGRRVEIPYAEIVRSNLIDEGR
jgi:ribosome maturation factor RimP